MVLVSLPVCFGTLQLMKDFCGHFLRNRHWSPFMISLSYRAGKWGFWNPHGTICFIEEETETWSMCWV